MTERDPSFNLWTEPWIELESPDGMLEELSLEQSLLRAGEFCAIYDPSPLVVAALHRLLVAILQDILNPQGDDDLEALWQVRSFPQAAVAGFGERYAHRFDLFSQEEPFLQSADLSREPTKDDKLKTVTYLMPQIPASSAVAHYRHGLDEENIFCPVCAARGLVAIPAFATSGGAGIRPSINGVPPIYVLPGGKTLYESLTASLVLPGFRPNAASKSDDAVWWRHDPVVPRKAVVHQVGYLHSLTFPARRVRLHPERMPSSCSRCGRQSAWGVRTMVYQMGEGRPKDAPFWEDPFAAYHIREGREPVPIRPRAGRALWREYAALFLPSDEREKDRTLPPAALYQRAQLAADGIGPQYGMVPVRCIGIRTDMKAKIFEWLDAGFDVPVDLLNDIVGSDLVRQSIQFANDCAGIISSTFRKTFGGSGQSERHTALRHRMVDAFWTALATPFRELVLGITDRAKREAARIAWVDQVVQEGNQAFGTFSEATGSNAATLRQRVTGQRICSILLSKKRKEQFPDERTET